MSYAQHLQQGLPPGRSICNGGGGGGGSSSSSQSTSTVTENTDKRIAIDSGIGISSDSSTVTVNALDSNIVQKALDTVAGADATAGQGFSQLIGLADKLFSGAGNMIERTQNASLAQLETLNTASNDKAGAVDQKTLIILGGVAVAVFAMRKKG